jgi:hypothetical protein
VYSGVLCHDRDVAILLLLLAVLAARAQPVGDGVPLVRQVSEAARSATGWRAGYDLGIDSDPQVIPAFGTSGSISKRKPLELNYPFFGGRIICDGTTFYQGTEPTSGPNPQRTESRAPATAELCTPLALRWDNLLDSLRSAVLAGPDEDSTCTVVEAEYVLPNGLGRYFPTERFLGTVTTREMCVDETRLVISWERFEGPTTHFAKTIVSYLYHNIERDPVFAPDEFIVPAPLPPARDALVPGLTGAYVDLGGGSLDLLNTLPLCLNALSVGCRRLP